MKFLWTITMLCLSLVACTPKPEAFYNLMIRTGENLVDTVKVEITEKRVKNKISLTYQTRFDTIYYIIDKLNKQKSRLIPFYDIQAFRFIKQHNVKIGNKIYKIDQYTTFNGGFDSGSEHYWHEEFGIFFTRSRTWPYYRVLLSTDENKNKIIWKLIEAVYPEIKEKLKYIDNLKRSGAIYER